VKILTERDGHVWLASTLGSLLNNHQEPSRIESRIRDKAISNLNNPLVVGLLQLSTTFSARLSRHFVTKSMSISRLKMLNLQTSPEK
jgi:hypothetical protein